MIENLHICGRVCSDCTIGGLALSRNVPYTVCGGAFAKMIYAWYACHSEEKGNLLRRPIHVLEMPSLSPIVTNFSFSFSLRMSSLATTPISFLSSSTTGTSTITL
jgi:hypothetical protein